MTEPWRSLGLAMGGLSVAGAIGTPFVLARARRLTQRNTVSVSMGSIMAQTTISIRITGKRRASARLHAGLALIRLAGRVIGCDIEIALADDDRNPRVPPPRPAGIPPPALPTR